MHAQLFGRAGCWRRPRANGPPLTRVRPHCLYLCIYLCFSGCTALAPLLHCSTAPLLQLHCVGSIRPFTAAILQPTAAPLAASRSPSWSPLWSPMWSPTVFPLLSGHPVQLFPGLWHALPMLFHCGTPVHPPLLTKEMMQPRLIHLACHFFACDGTSSAPKRWRNPASSALHANLFWSHRRHLSNQRDDATLPHLPACHLF